MSKSVLEISDLTKVYGRITAVNKLNLNIEAGQIFGMLGPNGSGKTTTLAMILGVVNPTAGSYKWFDQGNDHQLRKRIGSILEHPIFYPYMTAVQNLEIVCMIKDVNKKKIDNVIDIVGLSSRKNDPFRAYSLGMKQRLAIGSALLSDPDVLIFDEPTNGLDPQGIAQIRQLIIDIAERGKTIILASHLLDEVQKICSRFGVLRHGNLIHTGEVKQDFSEINQVIIGTENKEKAILVLEESGLTMEIKTEGDLLVLTIPNTKSSSDVNQLLFNNEVVLNHLSTKSQSLEEQFLEIVKNHG